MKSRQTGSAGAGARPRARRERERERERELDKRVRKSRLCIATRRPPAPTSLGSKLELEQLEID